MNFDEIWARHGQQNETAPELEEFARRLYNALVMIPLDLVEVHTALECLLVFLVTPAGRTDANCTAIDSFLGLGEFEWPELPDAFHDILADMAGTLHYTVSNPEIAANFDSTPEQLLVRIRRITA